MKIEVGIENVQHINKLNLSFDLSELNIICLVSKNGVGKTTVVKSLRNLQYADTFSKTSSRFIFNEKSRIRIKINELEYTYTYNKKIGVIDSRQVVRKEIKNMLFTELPIPFGERFNHFQTLSSSDDILREAIASESFHSPNELINFLQEIYGSSGYSNLKVTKIKKRDVYFILKEDGYYIREDYLSSGEFFVINLYKMFFDDKQLIIVDEIDISLDSSAQVKLVGFLKKLCHRSGKKIIFTTHSLALIKTLDPESIFYLESNDNVTSLANRSYNYIKATMFGFNGYDRYILTEDLVLQEYLEHVISQMDSVFFNYKIIYIGGADNTIDLMRRNFEKEIFSSHENVIVVLDGDQRKKLKNEWSRPPYDQFKDKIILIPFESVEKDLFEMYGRDPSAFPLLTKNNGDKIVFKGLSMKIGVKEIYKLIESRCPNDVNEFAEKIKMFLVR
jgi:ABC-type multidrug transport system ATPase subunit